MDIVPIKVKLNPWQLICILNKMWHYHITLNIIKTGSSMILQDLFINESGLSNRVCWTWTRGKDTCKYGPNPTRWQPNSTLGSPMDSKLISWKKRKNGWEMSRRDLRSVQCSAWKLLIIDWVKHTRHLGMRSRSLIMWNEKCGFVAHDPSDPWSFNYAFSKAYRKWKTAHISVVVSNTDNPSTCPDR